MWNSPSSSHRSAPCGGGLISWLLAILVAFVGYIGWRQLSPPKAPAPATVEPRTVTPRGNLADEEQSTIELFKKAAPAVVHITTTAVQRNIVTQDIFESRAGAGSGVVWDSLGHVVTNLHVIQHATRAVVTLNDNTSYDASLVGLDPDHDLAVLKITAPPERLLAIEVGTSHDLQVGQKAFAIGSPFEFDKTLTTGIVSGLNRTIQTDRTVINGAIQTDAAVNPGNSGGPLLDSAGRLIGLNTAIFSSSGGSHGIGFAIPVDVVRQVVVDILRDGSADRPWLGVVVTERLAVGGRVLDGLGVRVVAPGSPAERAGMLPMEADPTQPLGFRGDRITHINGVHVTNRRELLRALAQHKPGTNIRVTVIRSEQRLELDVTLEARPRE